MMTYKTVSLGPSPIDTPALVYVGHAFGLRIGSLTSAAELPVLLVQYSIFLVEYFIRSVQYFVVTVESPVLVNKYPLEYVSLFDIFSLPRLAATLFETLSVPSLATLFETLSVPRLATLFDTLSIPTRLATLFETLSVPTRLAAEARAALAIPGMSEEPLVT